MLMPSTDTTAILMPMEDTEPMAMEPTLTLTTDTSMERGPPMLRPSLRLMLMLTTDTTAILMPMEDTEPMAMEPTHMLAPPDCTTAMLDTVTLTLTLMLTERGPLMPSPRLMLMLMLTTDTTAMVPGPTTDTVWDTEE